MKLISNWVEIKFEEEPSEEIRNGLIIPRFSYQTTFRKGTVIGTGPGFVNSHGVLLEPEVEIGDSIFFDTRSLQIYKEQDGTEHSLIRDKEILLLIEED